MTTNNNLNFRLDDLSLIPNYIMEEILNVNGKSNAESLSENSDEYKDIEKIVNLQIEKEEHKKLKKEKFSILQRTLKKLIIQKLEVNFKTIYLIEGTIIFYYDEIFNYLIKDNKEINTIGHSDRLVYTYTLNGNEVLIIHKSALKVLLEMNISDQSRIFDTEDESNIELCEDFIESAKIEQYIMLYGLDINCIENIIKFIDNKLDISSLYHTHPNYYYLLMIGPYCISALSYYDKECYVINDETIRYNIFDLILSIILRIEIRDFIKKPFNSTLDLLYNRLEKVLKSNILADFETKLHF